MTLTSERPRSEDLPEDHHTERPATAAPRDVGGDELFGADMVDLPELRSRAHLYRWAAQDPDVIPLTTADPDFPAAPAIIDAVQRYVGAGYFSYGPVAGLPEFRESAARRVQGRHGVPCTADQIFVTNSAASAIYIAAEYIIERPGDEAIVFDPVDFLLRQSVVAAGGVAKRLPLRADRGFSFDPDELESLVVPGRTKLLSICNPHNPLGRVFSASDLQALARVALKYDLWIVSDEVWSDIVFRPSMHVSMAALSPEVAARTLSVFGFSKGFGLAGLRLGYLVTPSPTVHHDLLRVSHAIETAYGVSTLSQVAGMAAYEASQPWLERFVAHLHRERDYAVGRLNAIDGVSCHTPEGTFVLFPNVASFGVDVEELARDLLRSDRVAVVPGSPRFFGPAAAGHLRLSFATSHEILAEGLDRLEAGLDRVRGQAPHVRS